MSALDAEIIPDERAEAVEQELLATELPRPSAADAVPAGHVRIGYARASTVRQSLDTQVGSLRAAGVTRIFAEISTRATTRPELDKASPWPGRSACPEPVTIVVHEHKRLGRGIELAALAEQLRAAGIGLEFLTGELQGAGRRACSCGVGLGAGSLCALGGNPGSACGAGTAC